MTAPAISACSICTGIKPSRKVSRSVAVNSVALGLDFCSVVLGATCDFVAGTFGAGPWPRVPDAHRHEASRNRIPVRRADELFNMNKSVLLRKRNGPAM